MSVSDLIKEGKYVWRYKHVGFYGHAGASAPQRENDELDEWDKVFDSKKEFDKWYRGLVSGLAELDQVMNYCKYFVRAKGNKGKYVRDGKEHEVDGQWDGYHIWGNALFPALKFDYKLMASFKDFLIKNGWNEKNWFELMDKYERN